MLLKKTYSPHLIQIVREEEKMRLTVILVREVNSSPLYPHIIIWFDALKESRLVYSILLVRKKNGEPIDRLLEKVDPTLEFTPERVHFYGDVEVNSFTLKMQITSACLSSDCQIQPTKARQKIVRLLELGLGPIRDYYGGLLQKKEENLNRFKSSFPEINEEVIENFFHSIHPQKVQSILTYEILREFFNYTLLRFKEKKRDISKGKHGFFAYCISDGEDLLSSLKMEMYRKHIDLHSIISASIVRRDHTHISLLLPVL